MALKIYLSYGTTSDQVTALRLQALGAVNGLAIYVPPAFTRQEPEGVLDAHSLDQFRDSDVVLGVVTAALSEACWKELNAGKQAAKKVIILAAPIHAPKLEPHFPGGLILFDPRDPTRVEQDIVQFLRVSGLQQDASNALLALGTVALGLLIFAPQD